MTPKRILVALTAFAAIVCAVPASAQCRARVASARSDGSRIFVDVHVTQVGPPDQIKLTVSYGGAAPLTVSPTWMNYPLNVYRFQIPRAAATFQAFAQTGVGLSCYSETVTVSTNGGYQQFAPAYAELQPMPGSGFCEVRVATWAKSYVYLIGYGYLQPSAYPVQTEYGTQYGFAGAVRGPCPSSMKFTVGNDPLNLQYWAYTTGKDY